MKQSQIAKSKPSKAKIILILLAALIILCGGVWYAFAHYSAKNENKEPTAPEYFGSYEQLNSVPSRTDVSTSDPSILVAWMDQRVIDGNLSCTIYYKVDRRVLAIYVKTSGFNPEGKASSHTDYKSSDMSRNTIDQIAKDYCEAKQ